MSLPTAVATVDRPRPALDGRRLAELARVTGRQRPGRGTPPRRPNLSRHRRTSHLKAPRADSA